MLNICMKFHENISNGISVMELTRISQALTDALTYDGQRMNGRADTQNFGGYNIIPRHFFVAGHKNLSHNYPLSSNLS